ncbi:MAG TPA: TetR/AcrR family transcriptional regulator [Methanocellaceae archaeon]
MCQSDDKILDATIRVLAQEGYHGATTKKIAEEAGVNEVTVFRRFKNKENLIREARALSKKRSLESLEEAFKIDEDGNFKEHVAALGEYMSKAINDKANIIRIAIIEMQCVPPGEKAKPEYAIAALRHLREYFDEQVAKGNMRPVNTKTAALVLYSYIFYVECVCKINGIRPEYENETSFNDFLEIFMNGVFVPKMTEQNHN